jgi:hypothetical protein
MSVADNLPRNSVARTLELHQSRKNLHLAIAADRLPLQRLHKLVNGTDSSRIAEELDGNFVGGQEGTQVEQSCGRW